MQCQCNRLTIFCYGVFTTHLLVWRSVKNECILYWDAIRLHPDCEVGHVDGAHFLNEINYVIKRYYQLPVIPLIPEYRKWFVSIFTEFANFYEKLLVFADWLEEQGDERGLIMRNRANMYVTLQGKQPHLDLMGDFHRDLFILFPEVGISPFRKDALCDCYFLGKA
jgi:hypothetical protein